MKKALLFDFSVNKENSTIQVTREFAAPKPLVWAAWTTAEILDKWWAPKPYRAETKSLDFRVGGFWLYAMVGPESDKIWCKLDYLSIDAEKSYSAIDAFCDEHGEKNSDFPRSKWTNTFEETGDTTTVTIRIKYDTLADLEKYIELGFKEGFTMALGNLDEVLKEN